MIKINHELLLLERANQGLSLDEIAHLSGLSRHTISRIEKCQTNPRPSTLGKIVKALGKTIEDFIETEKPDTLNG